VTDRRYLRHFDFALLLLTLALVGLGLAMIFSATSSPSKPVPLSDNFVFRQVLYLIVGLALMVAVSFVDYTLFSLFARPLYGLILGLLTLTAVVGRVYGGAQRWIDLRLFPVQPSELSKVLLILVLAKFMADREGEAWSLWLSVLLVLPPMVLVYLQPNLGTTLILAVIWLGMIFAAGLPFWQLSLLGVGGIAAIPVVWLTMQDYMRERVLTFLNPGRDPLGAGYNIFQARIALGSGGWWGQGYLSGTQSQLRFLRVRHTDFIFSVLGEELGFVGAMIVFLLFALLLLRLLRDARLARDGFGRLTIIGITVMILFQSVVNIGVNIGVIPATGIPLPFVSYGGSSLITLLIAEGIVQSIVMRRRKLEF
jgi:rod shape determining protein RodA